MYGLGQVPKCTIVFDVFGIHMEEHHIESIHVVLSDDP